jgi:hypothetical protein
MTKHDLERMVEHLDGVVKALTADNIRLERKLFRSYERIMEQRGRRIWRTRLSKRKLDRRP